MSERLAESKSPDHRIARLTIDQYHRMIESGILREGEPIELLDGVLVYKDRSDRGEDPITVGKRHALAVQLLVKLDPRLEKVDCHIRIQSPICVPLHHEPEPDGSIASGQARDYSERLPEAKDVSCVFEVADSSLESDRTRKLAIYAAAGIPQYVIVNLVERQLEVHEQPVPNEGRYARSTTAIPGGLVSIQVRNARMELAVDELLP